MKIIFIICVLSLFNSILNLENVYDLKIGYNKRINQLKPRTSYNLYLSARKNQKFQISLNINSLSTLPLSILYIYEKSTKNSNYKYKSTPYYITNRNKKNISISYTVSAINSGYICIKFTPLSSITYINVLINEIKNGPGILPSYHKYNLSNNLTQTFYNLTKDIKYYFILDTSFLKTAKINIDMSLSSYLEDNYITVQENTYKDNFNNYNNISNYKLNGIIIDDILYKSNPIYYTTTYPSSKYLILNFIPKYNISNFSIKVELSGQKFNLIKNCTSGYFYLSSGGPYYLILDTIDEYKSVNLSFKSNNYINSLQYCELVNRYSPVKFDKTVRLVNKIYYNGMTSSFYYEFDPIKVRPQTIIFKLETSSFNNIDVQYDFYYIYTNSINLGNNGKLFNLVKGNEYRFKSYSSTRDLNITITLNDKYNKILPFNYLILKEYSYSNNQNLRRSSNISLSRTVKNGKLILTCNKYLYNYYEYLLIQILPNENVPDFDIKLNYFDYTSIQNTKNNTQKSVFSKNKNKSFIIIMIAVPILIAIIIIIIICYKCKKNSNYLNELNLDNLNQNNAVYSINDSIKNNEDEHNQQEDHHSYQEFNDYSYNKNTNDYMFPYDQSYGGLNRYDQQYLDPPNNNQNLVNSTIN